MPLRHGTAPEASCICSDTSNNRRSENATKRRMLEPVKILWRSEYSSGELDWQVSPFKTSTAQYYTAPYKVYSLLQSMRPSKAEEG